MKNQWPLTRFLFIFSLICIVLFSAFLCEDKDDEKLLPDTQTCTPKTLNITRKAEGTEAQQDALKGFFHFVSEQYGDSYMTQIIIENVCEDHDLNIKGAAYCGDGMCNGGFEWKVAAYINVDEYIYGPEDLLCIGGKCEFDLTIPADYTSIVSGKYKIEIDFVAYCGLGADCPPNYFDWKIDRLEVEVNYYEAS